MDKDISLARRIAFSTLKGVSVPQLIGVLDTVSDVDSFFEMSQRELCGLLGFNAPFCSEDYRKKIVADAMTEVGFVNKNNVRVRFYGECGYPTRLMQCYDAPIALYSIGNADMNAKHIISVVGTRRATSYGVDFTNNFIAELSDTVDDLLVISGLAYGIDVAAHRGALKANVPTAAVVAHGLNTIYPADHRNVAANIVNTGGSIISEYKSDAAIHKGNFLARNRIVAGLSDVVIVVESARKGGALVTADLAFKYDRDVCAVPGRVTDRYSQGCNSLIAHDKAHILRGVKDLLEVTGWEAKPHEGQQASFDFDNLPAEQVSIIELLRANPTFTTANIANSLGITVAQASARLTEMEMDDLLTSIPGGTFQLMV